MYDFWFTLGVASMSPCLLEAIDRARPAFTFIDRWVVEIRDGDLVTRRGPSTGLLERDATTRVRLAIAAYTRDFSLASPPIGIYTAGRFCQLINIARFQGDQENSSLRDIFASAYKAYVTALKGGAPSDLPTFPAMLGMCLMDQQVVDLIQNWPELSPERLDQITEILDEFGLEIGSRSWDILRAFVADPGFASAAGFLMAGDENPWDEDGVTIEQMMFWPDDGTEKGEHAVP
jgi:hypothetical protein